MWLRALWILSSLEIALRKQCYTASMMSSLSYTSPWSMADGSCYLSKEGVYSFRTSNDRLWVPLDRILPVERPYVPCFHRSLWTYMLTTLLSFSGAQRGVFDALEMPSTVD